MIFFSLVKMNAARARAGTNNYVRIISSNSTCHSSSTSSSSLVSSMSASYHGCNYIHHIYTNKLYKYNTVAIKTVLRRDFSTNSKINEKLVLEKEQPKIYQARKMNLPQSSLKIKFLCSFNIYYIYSFRLGKE